MSKARKASEARRRRSRLDRARLLAPALAAAAALTVLASACGGSSGNGVAQVETSGTTTAPRSQDGERSANPTAYSACMRRNGISKFPDPDSKGQLQIIGGAGLDPNSPRFKAAEKACRKFVPAGDLETPDAEEQARQLQEALKYSACIRKNGVPNFPDPKSKEGGIELSLDGSGVDFDSPVFKAAEDACKDLAPGANGGSTKRSNAP